MKKIKLLLVKGLLLAPAAVFAQDVIPENMRTLADNIKEAMTGPFVRALLAIFLCGAAVTYAFNKDNEKIKKNCIAIVVAAGILMGSTFVLEAVMGS
ncbi:MAG: TrbC/VirB2 family protein [Spirochaetaceae bacterium]|jgi:hypothetical protein|nr:TrbC/VirB2 family protein [Spirochaetaceae bacterium]